MKYFLIDENGTITNVIECADPTFAKTLGAVEVNPELDIGDTYTPYIPPEPVAEPTELEQMRADIDYIAMETGVEL